MKTAGPKHNVISSSCYLSQERVKIKIHSPSVPSCANPLKVCVFTILAASPTCFLVLISRLLSLDLIVSARIKGTPAVLPLIMANCYCRGSELDESRFKCK